MVLCGKRRVKGSSKQGRRMPGSSCHKASRTSNGGFDRGRGLIRWRAVVSLASTAIADCVDGAVGRVRQRLGGADMEMQRGRCRGGFVGSRQNHLRSPSVCLFCLSVCSVCLSVYALDMVLETRMSRTEALMSTIPRGIQASASGTKRVCSVFPIRVESGPSLR